MSRLARKIHRIVSYLVFIQVTIWIAGGLTFAVLPFDSVIKSGAVMVPPARPAFPGHWTQLALAHTNELGSLHGIEAHNSSQGLLLELQGREDSRWIRLSDGTVARKPLATEVESYARTLYQGEGASSPARYLDKPEYRLFGLLDELYGRTGVWQVVFEDGLGTRLYFDGETGRYLTVRNDFWLFYDAMWRLHIMDYRGGEDFNNKLLLVFAVLAIVFAISGFILTLTALRRALRSLIVSS